MRLFLVGLLFLFLIKENTSPPIIVAPTMKFVLMKIYKTSYDIPKSSRTL